MQQLHTGMNRMFEGDRRSLETWALVMGLRQGCRSKACCGRNGMKHHVASMVKLDEHQNVLCIGNGDSSQDHNLAIMTATCGDCAMKDTKNVGLLVGSQRSIAMYYCRPNSKLFAGVCANIGANIRQGETARVERSFQMRDASKSIKTLETIPTRVRQKSLGKTFEFKVCSLWQADCLTNNGLWRGRQGGQIGGLLSVQGATIFGSKRWLFAVQGGAFSETRLGPRQNL